MRRLVLLLVCLPILFGGTCDLEIHHKAMDFIKKNEGYRRVSYPDRPRKKTKRKTRYAICWGNQFLENGKRIKHVSRFTDARCNKIFYVHYFKRVFPKLSKDIKGNKLIVYADLAWQYGHVRLSKINSYPERGRAKLLGK